MNHVNKHSPVDLPWLFSLLTVLCVAWLQYVHWVGAHTENMAALIDAYSGVLNGTPHWRAYQNRLLSPAIVHVLGWVTNEPYLIFVQAWVAALNVALFILVHRITRSLLIGIFAVTASALLWTLETHPWSYTWDFTEAGYLLALAWMAVSGKSVRWLITLFVIALLNRESAVYLAVYMAAVGVAKHVYGQAGGKQMMIWGVALGVLALIWTEAVRSLLFQQSSLAGVMGDMAHSTFGNHVNLERNLQTAKLLLLQASPLLFIMGVYACTLLLVLVYGIEHRCAPVIGMAVALIAYFLSLSVFGLLHEARIYQPFNWCLPFLLAYVLMGRRQASAVP